MKLLIFAGTRNGRELALELATKGYEVIISSMSAHGNSLVVEHNNLTRVYGKMDLVSMERFIMDNRIQLVIDATHPYAKEISENIIKSTNNANIPMIRYERKSSIPEHIGKHFDTYEAACDYLRKRKGPILFTTGVNHIDKLVDLLDKSRIVVRILPVETSLEKANQCGLQESQIIAIHPPYSIEDNLKHINMYHIRYLVTKDSGYEGGTYEKLEAVKKTGTGIIVIDRPKIDYPMSCYDLEEIIDELKRIN